MDTWITNLISTLHMNKLTPVQEACIPEILKNRDVVACAETGSGKTACFALPVLQMLAKENYGPFCLCLTPTRELAFQIAEQFSLFGQPIQTRVAIITGGMCFLEQAKQLSKKPHIIVACPGRLADLIRGSKFFFNIRVLVLDEADKLLGKSFLNDLQLIFESIPKKRQNLLFSATKIPPLNNAFIYNEDKKTLKLQQFYILVPLISKELYLLSLLEQRNEKAIVFTSRCRVCAILNIILNMKNIKTTALNSYMNQQERFKSLQLFKSNMVQVLVTTDLSARGLDVPRMGLVINYDVPNSLEDYTHRIGRTARAGQKGTAVSFVSDSDMDLIKNINQHHEIKEMDFNLDEKNFCEINVMKRMAVLEFEQNFK